MGQIIKDQKLQNRHTSYEGISTYLETREDLIYYMNKEPTDHNKIFVSLIDRIESFMAENHLNENEIKVGGALIEVFTNYDEIFIHGAGNKFNKNLVLLSLREMTNLSTKEIRNSLKKYKMIYKVLSDELQD
jgi:hypothetical protein